MYSNPYKFGEYWRVDTKENGRKKYYVFEDEKQARDFIKEHEELEKKRG